MLEYLTLILICQLAGEFVVNAAGLPIPGPVIGMILLFLFLIFKGEIPQQLESVTRGLLNNLSLMFVPAGVGVMVHLKLLEADGAALLIAIVVSTALTIMVTAWVMTKLAKIDEQAP